VAFHGAQQTEPPLFPHRSLGVDVRLVLLNMDWHYNRAVRGEINIIRAVWNDL
jgi:hypothetical protein